MHRGCYITISYALFIPSKTLQTVTFTPEIDKDYDEY